MKVDSRFSATAIHNTLNVDWLDVQRKKLACREVYKLVNGKGLPVPVQKFQIIQPMRMLRSNEKLKLSLPKTKTAFAGNDFLVRGVHHWHKPPANVQLQLALSIDAFKTCMKNPHVFEHIT